MFSPVSEHAYKMLCSVLLLVVFNALTLSIAVCGTCLPSKDQLIAKNVTVVPGPLVLSLF